MSVFSEEQKEYLDATYKRKDACESDMEARDSVRAELVARLIKLETQNKLIIGILSFVGAGVGTLIIGSLWRLIAK